MSQQSRLWRWLWGPNKKPPIPPLDQPENLNEINADLDDARRAQRRRGNPKYRTVDPHEIHWGPKYNTEWARNYNPEFNRHTWRQWLLLHAPWPTSMTHRRASDLHPFFYSPSFWVLIAVAIMVLIACATIYFLNPPIQAYIDRLFAIPEEIFLQ